MDTVFNTCEIIDWVLHMPTSYAWDHRLLMQPMREKGKLLLPYEVSILLCMVRSLDAAFKDPGQAMANAMGIATQDKDMAEAKSRNAKDNNCRPQIHICSRKTSIDGQSI